MKKWIVWLLLVSVFATLAGCSFKNWTCDVCGKSFTGKAYYGWSYDDTMCEDCARKYWMPLNYKNYLKD